MKIKEFLKGVATVSGAFNPAIGAVVGVVNQFLPDEEKMPMESTGQQVLDKIDQLPPDQQKSILEKEIDLKIAQEEGWTARYTAMTKADGQSTRPKIAMMMAQVLCFEILAFTVWGFVYPTQLANPVLWTVFGTLTGVPATLLGKYFGELRKEQNNRTSALTGVPIKSGIEKIIQSFK